MIYGRGDFRDALGMLIVNQRTNDDSGTSRIGSAMMPYVLGHPEDTTGTVRFKAAGTLGIF